MALLQCCYILYHAAHYLYIQCTYHEHDLQSVDREIFLFMGWEGMQWADKQTGDEDAELVYRALLVS